MIRPAKKRWIDRHRPRSLAEVFGQGFVVHSLKEYAANPYPVAFLFSGPTGVGKTSVAHALATELGVNAAANMIEVNSGQLDAETVEWLMRQFRFAPMGDVTQWRLVLLDEADLMSPAAERRFLSVLDEPPTRTVLVFTTNRPDWFASRQRLLDRLEHYPFASDAAALRHDAQLLVQQVWLRETGRTDAPPVESLPGAIINGQVSFRRVVAALQDYWSDLNSERESFALSSPREKAASLLSMCGPYGRKPKQAAPSTASEIRARRAAVMAGQWDLT